jgi:benzil reductase ((S)-benzoin forming)
MHLSIITGTSRGLGEALARATLAPDVALHTVSRRSNPALGEAAREAGARLVEHELDLRETHRIPALVAEILAGEHGIESATLINNAGVLEPIGPVRDIAPDALATHIAVNLTAVMQLTGSFLSRTRETTYPRTVVSISSGAASKPYEGWGPYCATKAGLELFTQVTALEEAAAGGENGRPARILAVAPGVVDTDMQGLIRQTPQERFPNKPKFVDLKESGRLADPARAAELVLRAARDPALESGSCVDVRTLYGG